MKHLSALFALLLLIAAAHADNRGLKRHVKDPEGRTVVSYGDSYALLVGVSDYTTWPDLESIPAEIARIKTALEAKGFSVRTVLNPQGKQLKYAYETFIDDYGYVPQNRLLFYFAGHGYTADDKGYLVSADAPLPGRDTIGFKRKSFNMSSLLAMARKMDARHALFLFDSCFSGTIFKTRALPKTPPYIVQSMAQPVRQFITAGSAGEEVPAVSTFAPMFIDAINGDADLNRDGYVTGSEVGLHLSQQLPTFKRQHPQYGKIDDYKLSRGDFVFFAPGKAAATPPSTFRFETVRPNTFALTVTPDPADATVYITNIKPRYRDGIRLAPGTYEIKVTRDGYLTKRGSVDLRSDMTVPVTLEKDIRKSDPTGTSIYDSLMLKSKALQRKQENRTVAELLTPKPVSKERPIFTKTTPAHYEFVSANIVRDLRSGFWWDKNGPRHGLTWDDAVQYCETLVVDGKSGWRLPTLDELKTLYEKKLHSHIDARFFTVPKKLWFWSASEKRDSAGLFHGPTQAWIYDFDYGFEGSYEKAIFNSVRCIKQWE